MMTSPITPQTNMMNFTPKQVGVINPPVPKSYPTHLNTQFQTPKDSQTGKTGIAKVFIPVIIRISLLALGVVGAAKLIGKGGSITTLKKMEEFIENSSKKLSLNGKIKSKPVKVRFPVMDFLNKTPQELNQAKLSHVNDVRKSMDGVLELSRRYYSEGKESKIIVYVNNKAKAQEIKEFVEKFGSTNIDGATKKLPDETLKEITGIDLKPKNAGVIGKDQKGSIKVDIQNYDYVANGNFASKAWNWFVGKW